MAPTSDIHRTIRRDSDSHFMTSKLMKKTNLRFFFLIPQFRHEIILFSVSDFWTLLVTASLRGIDFNAKHLSGGDL